MLRVMSESTDLYRILRVEPDAEFSSIRAAYRTLAWQYHPDVGGSQRMMASLNEAWRILRDPGARAVYDGRRSPIAKPRQSAHPPAAPKPPPGDPAPTPTATRRDEPTPPVAAAPSASSWQAPERGRSDGSTVLDFGRYQGWSLSQVSAVDSDYLEWLARTSIGRRLQPQIVAILEARRSSSAARRGADRPATAPARRWGRARTSAAR
jgi:curved DNA-binding protein CbpA